MHTLHQTRADGSYQVKDPEKLIRIAKEWGVETEGKDIYELAHEIAEVGLMEYASLSATRSSWIVLPSTPRSCGRMQICVPRPLTARFPVLCICLTWAALPCPRL